MGVWGFRQVLTLRLNLRTSDLDEHMPVLKNSYIGPLLVPRCLGKKRLVVYL